jgi:hypothetical protein
MRLWIVLSLLCVICAPAFAEQDKKTDDLKPADPDIGESTLEERTLGLLPNPFEKQGIKFAITNIAKFSVIPWAALSGARFTKIVSIFAVDTGLEKLVNLKQVSFHANAFQIDGGGLTCGGAAEFFGCERHRGAADDAALRGLAREKWGREGRSAPGQFAADTEFINSKCKPALNKAIEATAVPPVTSNGICVGVGSRSAPIVTLSRSAFFDCLYGVTACTCSDLTPLPVLSLRNLTQLRQRERYRRAVGKFEREA